MATLGHHRPDSLPPRILKECASVLSSPLCFFFNKSFSTGKLPHLWKLANITPLFKKGSKTERNNYRQISLKSIVCKIAEKIVKSRVIDFWRDIIVVYVVDMGGSQSGASIHTT